MMSSKYLSQYFSERIMCLWMKESSEIAVFMDSSLDEDDELSSSEI